jgi:CDP-paratose 2-epimerase
MSKLNGSNGTSLAKDNASVLITGGAGFVGTNLADRLLSAGRPVVIFDNLSRAGVEQNLDWLVRKHGSLVRPLIGDIRDRSALRSAVEGTSQVFHFAAQVAVTTSLVDPIDDFEINATGTLNLLEAIRQLGPEAPSLIFTSTNKVYGSLEDVELKISGSRYQPVNGFIRRNGIDEGRPVEFHSPYGCSKGAADQYVLDYARTYGLRAAVFRMSCIYGEHQFGTEDQGWVAHFCIRALEDKKITIYGDGMQVRDILFAEDLVDAFLLAQKNIEKIAGQAFNIGGGAANTTSLLELIDIIGELRGRPCDVTFEDLRLADQRYYVSDWRRFHAITGWKPTVAVREGVTMLFEWLADARGLKKRASSAGVKLKPAAVRNGHAANLPATV